jgi:hypothetical protein
MRRDESNECAGEIAFLCDDKCRICPQPGANCKSNISVTPMLPERDKNFHYTWIDFELMDEELKNQRK